MLYIYTIKIKQLFIMKAINKIKEEIKRQQTLLKIAKNYQIVLDAWNNREVLNENYKFRNLLGEDRLFIDEYYKHLFFLTKLDGLQSIHITSFLESYKNAYDVQHPNFKEIKKLQEAVKFIEWFINHKDEVYQNKFWEVYNLQEMH